MTAAEADEITQEAVDEMEAALVPDVYTQGPHLVRRSQAHTDAEIKRSEERYRALVQGGAYGGGAGLAAACDVAIATADAAFAFSEVRLGLIAATISPYVIAAIGQRRARSLFATGQTFDAALAQHIGLIDEVVEDAAGLAAARERFAAEIMACAPGAVAASKRLVAEVAGRAIDHGLMADTARRIAHARVGEEGQEGVRAFLQRRKPGWAER